MQSIKQVANTYGVTDRTVRNWLELARKELGNLGTLRSGKLLFTDDEVTKLASYGRQSDPESEVIESEFVVEEGNHKQVKTLTVPNTASLERFRTDRIRQALANPGEFVGQVDGFLDELEGAMDAAEAQQERELFEIRQTKRQAQKRIEQFRRRSDEYRLKTDILASIQNAELDDLGEMAEEVSSLGKPQAIDDSNG
jgi:hypothetical protein